MSFALFARSKSARRRVPFAESGDVPLGDLAFEIHSAGGVVRVLQGRELAADLCPLGGYCESCLVSMHAEVLQEQLCKALRPFEGQNLDAAKAAVKERLRALLEKLAEGICFECGQRELDA